MPAKRKKEPRFDEENPEWNEEDFARAKRAHKILPPEILSAFKKTRGLPKSRRRSRQDGRD